MSDPDWFVTMLNSEEYGRFFLGGIMLGAAFIGLALALDRVSEFWSVILAFVGFICFVSAFGSFPVLSIIRAIQWVVTGV